MEKDDKKTEGLAVDSASDGSVFVVSHSWDDMNPPSWGIKAIFDSRQSAVDAIERYPKSAKETGFEPIAYKVEEFPILSQNK